MLIEEQGYKGIALNNIEAYGMAVNDLTAFTKQRSRWARGCVQIFKKYKKCFTLCKEAIMEEKIEIIIVDDHSLIREGLKQLLELDGDIQVIGEAGNNPHRSAVAVLRSWNHQQGECC